MMSSLNNTNTGAKNMRKIVVSTQMTLNGVEENPQNWVFDYVNEEFMTYASDQLKAADALIMGRVTYEAFAEAWSSRAGADAYADRMNSLPKYVASRTVKDGLTWNSSLIGSDLVAEVTKLKQQPGGDILQYGIGELTYTLLEHGLIDELRFMVFPVVVGKSGHIFDHIDKANLKLLESKTFSTGVMILHYQPQPKA
jgi:dihydrofolate reductase